MSDRISCSMAEEMIPAYVGGGCTDKEKKLLEKHCSECPDCAGKLIRAKKQYANTDQGREEEPEADEEALSRKTEEGPLYRKVAEGVLVIAIFVYVSYIVAKLFQVFWGPVSEIIFEQSDERDESWIDYDDSDYLFSEENEEEDYGGYYDDSDDDDDYFNWPDDDPGDY